MTCPSYPRGSCPSRVVVRREATAAAPTGCWTQAMISRGSSEYSRGRRGRGGGSPADAVGTALEIPPLPASDGAGRTSRARMLLCVLAVLARPDLRGVARREWQGGARVPQRIRRQSAGDRARAVEGLNP